MIAVKICGLTNLQDARSAWQSGADLLGLVFVPSSPRYIAPAEAAQIIHALVSEGCALRFVGVFADAPCEMVQRVMRECALHLAQLHGHELPSYARAIGPEVIVARRVREGFSWDELAPYEAWAYLLDSSIPGQLGGTGQSWRWDLLPKDDRPFPRIIVAGGLRPENVQEAIRQVRPWGVDISSGVEACPGKKDPSRVRRFIEMVREEEQR
jgi:phosphoribosylanthranilate isomerase